MIFSKVTGIVELNSEAIFISSIISYSKQRLVETVNFKIIKRKERCYVISVEETVCIE